MRWIFTLLNANHRGLDWYRCGVRERRGSTYNLHQMSVFHFGFCTLHLSCLPDSSVEKIMYLQRIVNFSSHSLTKTVWSHIHDSIALTCVPWFVWCVCQVGKIMFYNCNNKILHMWIKNFCQICAKSQTREMIVWSNYSKSIFF